MMKSTCFLFLLLNLLVADLAARTIKVGAKEKVQHIKEAITLAKMGDTILVSPGVYREGNIILEKSVVIIGKEFPVLDGEDKYEIFTIHANHVVVQGFQF